MRQEYKFCEEDTQRGGLSYSAYLAYSTSLVSFQSDISSPPVANYHSPITAFLIDTPAIRITPNSFQCIAELHSNRHSSDPRTSHENCKSSLSTVRTTSKSGQARTKLKTTGKLPFSHTFSTLFGCAEHQCYPLESAPWRGFS
jgi:hypothetical protein